MLSGTEAGISPDEQGQLVIVESINKDMRPLRIMNINTDITETGA